MDTADIIHEYGNFNGGVIKLGSAGLSVIALLVDCIRVWDCVGGYAIHKISLVRSFLKFLQIQCISVFVDASLYH